MDTIQKQDVDTTVAVQSKPLNLWQRLNAIKKAVAYVQKDKEVTGAGSYMAVTHDAITAATRLHFIEHGVMIVPHEVASSTVDSGMVTGKGNPIIRFEAKYRIEFVNIDSPTEREAVEVTSHALDQGDKAPGKALSYAVKTAILKALQIETGVDDEGREESKPKKHADIPLPNGSITPLTGAEDLVTGERKVEVDKLFSRIVDFKDVGDMQGAHDLYYGIKDPEEALYLWAKLKPHSAFRSALKKHHKETPNGI